ncbi:MAG: dTDP-4-dehydrorhamnose 3,5-epimerase family protein [Thermodesulfobacteriota bacterium]
MFKDGPIDGVEIRPLRKYADERGWLMELFRKDEIDESLFPAMTYISMTEPGVTRGPHEHVAQTDYFCFAGPSNFRIFLWDNRSASPTYRNRMVFVAGEDQPSVVIVPEGVVHAYKNRGETGGLVINCPNRLFMGPDKREAIDEIRYENDASSPFKVE